MPYDSFLLDPILLFFTGLCAAWLIARRPVHTRAWALRGTVVVTLVVYWGTSVSLYFDLEWTRWLWEMCGAASGRDWMLNSGLFHFDYLHSGWPTHVLSVLIFLTYPIWLLGGIALGTPRLADSRELATPRWRGQRLRQEVWYGTATDPRTGHALWLHAETVAPAHAAPYAHGWAAFFPADGAPVWSRFGPQPCDPQAASPFWFATDPATFGPTGSEGRTPRIAWKLDQKLRTPPLWPFPRWLWEMELLPGALAILDPHADWSGTVTVDGEALDFAGPAGLSRIYGHGSALRWAWLHADLGDGNVLEIVSAVSMRRGLNRLKPVAFVRLRHAGHDWPRWPLLAALTTFRCEPALPRWTLHGTLGNRRLRVEVTLPPERCVEIGYRDPDGRAATCTHSSRADAVIVLEARKSGSWTVQQRWELLARAHAEVGMRPSCET